MLHRLGHYHLTGPPADRVPNYEPFSDAKQDTPAELIRQVFISMLAFAVLSLAFVSVSGLLF